MIVNEALCYILYCMHSSAPDNVKRVIINFYNSEEIIAAKKALWDKCSDHLGRYHDHRTTDGRPQYQPMHKIS